MGFLLRSGGGIKASCKVIVRFLLLRPQFFTDFVERGPLCCAEKRRNLRSYDHLDKEWMVAFSLVRLQFLIAFKERMVPCGSKEQVFQQYPVWI